MSETGMLDVGAHCTYCRQIDFLPFHCGRCGGDFCGPHRSPNEHGCGGTSDNEDVKETKQEPRTAQADSFQSLLPEKAHVRVKQVRTQASSEPTVRATLEAHGHSSALAKLKRFFAKATTPAPSGRGAKSGPANRLVALAKLRQSARGDPRVPAANRVYVYCYVVDEHAEKEVRHELFINKLWPVGRALDYIATQLDVTNKNTSVSAGAQDRLVLFRRGGDSELDRLDSGTRVATAIHDSDTLYLVRGDAKSM
ncbi:LADA_0D07492g1_1 [Lachancea dasiensis]|uniref:LADA_0D07492g1_1 n=1 Tax=Lachancea dasiensis TaxID=1072105 RepID=A0A1G4J773_9SACH|nr:LADA_0D07492g1_1 [Lachancea dasiensis]